MEEIKITCKQIEELKLKAQQHKGKPGPLMPTLQDAQNIMGCVPKEIQMLISEELNEPVAKINGIISFYAQFSEIPKGKKVIGVCIGTACYVKGSQKILDLMVKELGIKTGETTDDHQFTLEATRCIGACGLAPVMSINEEVHGKLVTSTAKDILDNARSEN